MALITDITAAWSAGTATAGAEIWQCVEGSVAVSVEADPGPLEGIRLRAGDAVKIAVGKTVKYRLNGNSASAIAVEAFE